MNTGPNQASDAVSDADGQSFPRAFGNYVLLTNFAQGGMGEVYLAKTGGIAGIDRLCVLKKLRADVNREDEYVRRFTDEARIVVQLSHANICHVFDAGQVGNQMYLAMEYVPGANLRDIFSRARKLLRDDDVDISQGLAAAILAEVLDALDYAHRLKHPLTGLPLDVVHRDVSPQNILVSFEGEVKLIDFGLAKSSIKTEQTESQVVMGKVAYMSPEQARGDDVAPATDQFAAGVVLYELATKKRFYGEYTNYQIWQVVGRGGFVPPNFSSLDLELQHIVSRATHKDAHRRYGDCGEFKEALELYVRKNYPQVTKRRVRELMDRLYGADREQERAFLAQFAHVSAANVRAANSGPVQTSFVEATVSDGSLHDAPAKGVPVNGAGLVAPKMSADESARAGAPDEQRPIAEEAPEPGGDLPWHARTETAGANSEAIRALATMPLNDASSVFGKATSDETARAKQAEHTEVVTLSRTHSSTDASSTNAAMVEAYGPKRTNVYVAAVVVALLIGAVVWLLMRPDPSGVVAVDDPVAPTAEPAADPVGNDIVPNVEPAAPVEPAVAIAPMNDAAATKKVVVKDTSTKAAAKSANRVTKKPRNGKTKISRTSSKTEHENDVATTSKTAAPDERDAAAKKNKKTRYSGTERKPFDKSKAKTWGDVMPYLRGCPSRCAKAAREKFSANFTNRDALGSMQSSVSSCALTCSKRQ